MSNDGIFAGPGVLVVTRSDWDGWPQGMPVCYAGPFDDWDAAYAWADEKLGVGHSGYHISWHQMTLDFSRG